MATYHHQQGKKHDMTKTKPTLEEQADALRNSISHWTNDHLKLSLFGGEIDDSNDVFNGAACGLCQLHHRASRKYQHPLVCGRCPLRPPDRRCGCGSDSNYWWAMEAVEKEETLQFEIARAALLRDMYAALHRVYTRIVNSQRTMDGD